MKKIILEARIFNSSYAIARERTVKDYEIDIECSDNRIYTYNKKTFKLKRGDVLIRTPGGVVSSLGIQKSYIMTLDFSLRGDPLLYSRNIPGILQAKTENELITSLPPVIHPRNPYMLFEIYEKLIRNPVLSSESALSLADEIIYIINSDVAHEKYLLSKSKNNAIDKAMSYMENNLSSRISLDELAAISSLEKSYLIRLFKKETGSTPLKILSEMRLNRACDLLATTDMNIVEIASKVGYNTPSFFISEYKKRFGITPFMHRKSIRHE